MRIYVLRPIGGSWEFRRLNRSRSNFIAPSPEHALQRFEGMSGCRPATVRIIDGSGGVVEERVYEAQKTPATKPAKP